MPDMSILYELKFWIIIAEEYKVNIRELLHLKTHFPFNTPKWVF